MLQTMRSLMTNLDILKVETIKLMNTKSNQEEINKLILKSLTYSHKKMAKIIVVLGIKGREI